MRSIYDTTRVKYRNKNILFITVAILLVIGSFVFAEYRNKPINNTYVAENSKNDLVASTNSIDSPQNIDTDGDGSKDWEEILVGTNPNDPKSKPSLAKSATTNDLTKVAPEKLDQVDTISREFFARYMELRQLGSSEDKASRESLAKQTVGNIVLAEPKDYKITEILTKSDSSNEAIKLYGEQVSEVYKKYMINSRDEGVITLEASEQENPELLKEIDPIILSYKNTINALLKIKVPKPMELMHLDLINAMNGSLFIAQSFRNSGVNPIEGIQAVAYYETALTNLYNAISAIKSYFNYLGLYEDIF